MSKLVVDTATRDRMLAAGEPVDVFDESGKYIGRFTPDAGGVAGRTLDEKYAELGVTRAELDRRMREGTKYTQEQVMERLVSIVR